MEYRPVIPMFHRTVQEAEMAAAHLAREWGRALQFWRDTGVPHVHALAACARCDDVLEIRGRRDDVFRGFRGLRWLLDRTMRPRYPKVRPASATPTPKYFSIPK
jgi:hypothetical protein